MYRCIVTVGPSSANENVLKDMKSAGADCFRINLSHSNTDKFHQYTKLIQRANLTPSIDTQGAQGRVLDFDGDEEFELNDPVVMIFDHKIDIKGDYPIDRKKVILNHPEILEQIISGDILRIDFSGLAIQITDKANDYAFGKVISEGTCQKNRAFDIVNKTLILQPLTAFDKWCLGHSQVNNIKTIFHSFASQKEDILLTRSLMPKGSEIIAKIENKMGITNLKGIAEVSDGILIDRGDLSREYSISMLPPIVNRIVKYCVDTAKPVYIATNVLDSMMYNKLPSRSEISDIYNLMERGVTGMVLAAEAAIGQRPIESVHVINHMRKVFEDNIQEFNKEFPKRICDDSVPDELKHWL